jgi:hypothetical protein
LQDANNTASEAAVDLTTSAGDRERLMLRRTGPVFTGSIYTRSGYSAVNRNDNVLQVVPWDYVSAYYTDADTGSGAARQISITTPVTPDYSAYRVPNVPQYSSGAEYPLFNLPAGSRLSGINGSIVLPFDFPFFEQRLRRIFVDGDGVITFGARNWSTCPDYHGLSSIPSVAPLGLELYYGGSAQSGENIYFSTAPDSVTVRWAAETPGSTIAQPEAVNFSATLFSDGRIWYQYGKGNRNLSAAGGVLASAGCPTSPFVGISNGHETYAVSYNTSGVANMEGAPAIQIFPPFEPGSAPEVTVESPAPGAKVQSPLVVRGLAPDSEVISRIDLLIDGVAVGRTLRSVRRDDICSAGSLPGCPFVGFQAVLNLEALGVAPGQHNLAVRATNRHGAIVEAPPVPFEMAAGQTDLPIGAIEAPAAGAAVSGTVAIRGYAYSGLVRVTAADVLVDGTTYAAASYGVRREDICATPSLSPNCPGVGFTANLNTSSGAVWLPNGKHVLQVRVRDETGRYTLIPAAPLEFTVDNPVNQPPRGVLVSPAPNAVLSGNARISGYAWDPDGRVTSVNVILWNFATSVSYGLPRPEECAKLPEVAACPNIGFDATLDTRRYPNGTYVLGIRLIDNSGASVIIPNTLRGGINVEIRN